MKKYVVGYEEQCWFICKTRADAEEMILSIVEENMYEDWYSYNYSSIWHGKLPYETPAEYIATNRENYRQMSALAWALYSCSSGHWIDEVEELE